jgi:hypothetical protein
MPQVVNVDGNASAVPVFSIGATTNINLSGGISRAVQLGCLAPESPFEPQILGCGDDGPGQDFSFSHSLCLQLSSYHVQRLQN